MAGAHFGCGSAALRYTCFFIASPGSRMLDKTTYLRERLGKLGLGTHREAEIVRELSEHMADHTSDLKASGVAQEAAAREALDSVSNWFELRNEIVSAET